MNEAIMEQNLLEVKERVDKLEESQEELRRVIGGDLTGKPGVLQNQVRMINALFDEKEGVVPRLTAMERRELERMGFVRGAYWMWGLIGVVLGFLIKLLIK